MPTCAFLLLLSLYQPADLKSGLTGTWAGYLEYRDYSEPPTSTKRVRLPTWLAVTSDAAGLVFHYSYDDGPNKLVEETATVTIDTSAKTYTITESDHPAQVLHIEGLDSLRNGHGQLILTGKGTDDHKPADLRETLTIRRNLIEWTLESKPADSDQPYAFRHLYRFTRAAPPR